MELSKRVRKAVNAVLIALCLLIANGNLLKAQPDNYCVPYMLGGPYYFCYPAYAVLNWGYFQYYGGVINEFKIYDASGVQLDRVSSGPATQPEGGITCYVNSSETAQLAPGSTYKFNANVHLNGFAYTYYNGCQYSSSTYYTCRMYIDYNMDGDFEDQGEWINDPSGTNTNPQWRRILPWCSNQTWEYNVTIPDNVDIGKTRMRVMASYYYPYLPYYVPSPCFNGYYYKYPGYTYVYDYGETEDYILEFTLPVKESFPSNEDPDNILYANEWYDGTTRTRTENDLSYDFYYKKPFVRMGSACPAGSILTYQIVGPLPSQNVIYEGLNASGSPNFDIGNFTGNITMDNARGVAANSNGGFKYDKGGEYQLVLGLTMPGKATKYAKRNFNVSWENDLSASDISSPRTSGSPFYFKYPRGIPIKVTGTFFNVGVKNVTKFNAYAIMYDMAGNVYKRDSIAYDTSDHRYQVLKPKGRVTLDFSDFVATAVGKYKLVLSCDLKNAKDLEEYNNSFPRPDGEAYYFEIQDEVEAAVDAITLPKQSDVVIAGRPIVPKAELINNGVGDISDAKAKFIYRKLPNGKKDSVTMTVKDIPAGRYNHKSITFDPMDIAEPGEYEAWVVVDAIGDKMPENNSKHITFTVISGLNGTYTVGKKFINSDRNFPTIDSAMNALYYYGMRSSVNMVLTDAEYQISSIEAGKPAWDMTSTIIGLGYNKTTNAYDTLTWLPSTEKAVTRGSIKIVLNSSNGKGVQFGQSTINSNPYALLRADFGVNYIRKFANNGGYIRFDGGHEKSFKFVINSQSAHASAFYLSRGSKNITIQNCLIENGTPATKNNNWLPRTKYTATDGFTYTDDISESVDFDYSYSAGIVNRSTLSPILTDTKELSIDTIPNTNNTFSNNEISGFGYGVVSIGIGPLFSRTVGDFTRYYNTNNTITNNLINNVSGAGVFVGFEENTVVSFNKVWNNDGSSNNDAAGIIAGSPANDFGFAYNNLNLTINGNEVNNIASKSKVTGIDVMQAHTRYMRVSNSTYAIFPDMPDNINVYSNAVWGLKALNASTARTGISVMTERKSAASIYEPKNNDVSVKNVLVANNSVIIEDDMLPTKANIIGIGALNVLNAKVMNNAVAVTDETLDAQNQLATIMLYEGMKPAAGIFESDYNAYYTSSDKIPTYRFIETDANTNVLEFGYTNEYKDIEQWLQWTKNDLNSVSGVNFLNDMAKIGNNPTMLRIRTNPSPKGSVLDNRGDRLPIVSRDIENQVRGAANRRYDLGALEFDGIMNVDDTEIMSILEPGAYRAGAPMPFNEAEYVMTTAPVDVKVRMHNSGSGVKTGTNVTVNIAVEQIDGSFAQVLETSTKVKTVESTESTDFVFGLADGIGTEFIPQTYGELNRELLKNSQTLYTVPAIFNSMESTVTPLYKIKITAEPDEFNNNNTIEKTVRFYILHSPLEFLVSGETDRTPLGSGAGSYEIAAKLNLDTVMTGLKKMGWFTDISKYKYDVDYFNRNAWEPRAVNYGMYRTMIWSDGLNSSWPTRYIPISLTSFLSKGSTTEKKNLIFASQEAGKLGGAGLGTPFFNNDLRAYEKSPYSPLGLGVDYSGNTITGVGLARNMVSKVMSTGVANDDFPKPALFSINNNGDGLSQIAYIYNKLEVGKNGENGKDPAPNTDRIMGVATSTIAKNVVLLGIDWRHFGKVDDILRGSFDFIENNGGTVVPVELLDFSAEANGKRVDLSWATASELNSSKFEIERATVAASGMSSFAKIDEMPAAGKTIDVRHYGPIVDRNVEWGSTYVYRLRMLDRDGTSSYSSERTVALTADVNGFALTEIKPNPVKNTATVSFTLGTGMTISAELYDMNGKKVADIFNGYKNAGSNDLTIDASSLPSGAYTIIINAAGKTITESINVVK